MDHLIENIETLIDTVENLRTSKRLLPCLSLLYTGMDVMGSLERQPGEGTKQSFTHWADTYLAPKGLPCTSLELFAARCGVLHTYTPESNLSQQGQVRRVYYAWGSARAEELQTTIDTLGTPEVAVHLDDLFQAFREAVADFFDEVANDVSRQSGLAQRAGLWFSNMHPALIQAFNLNHEQS